MKRLKFIVLMAALTVTFAGCGKAATPATQAATTQEAVSDRDEGKDDSAKAHTPVDDVPAANGSTAAANYWQGSDYFDIVSYANANGCDHIRLLRDDASITKDEAEAKHYVFYFNNSSWMVTPTIGCSLIKLNSSYVRVAEYDVLPGALDESERLISVSRKNNAMLPSRTIEKFVDVVNAIKSYPNSDDPLSEAGVEHTKLR